MAHPLLEEVKYNADGLIAAVAQCADTHEVLMLAWMNADALTQTLVTGQVTYFSRSRQALMAQGRNFWPYTRTCISASGL